MASAVKSASGGGDVLVGAYRGGRYRGRGTAGQRVKGVGGGVGESHISRCRVRFLFFLSNGAKPK